MDLLKVENDSLVRDINTGAILETDRAKLNRHRARKASLESREKIIDSLLEKINNLEEKLERMSNGNNNT